MSMRDNKLTVPLPLELRLYVSSVAEREDRTEAAWVRHLIAESARRERQQGKAA